MLRSLRRYALSTRVSKSYRNILWTAVGSCLLLYIFLELLRQPNLLKKRFRKLQIKQDLFVSSVKEDEDSDSRCLLPPMRPLPGRQPPFRLNCTTEHNWVNSGAGRFVITDATKKAYPDVKCAMVPVLMEDDYSVYYGDAVDGITSDRKLTNDFFVANCVSEQHSKQYQLLHAGISKKDPRQSKEQSSKAEQLSIIIFGLDSVSREAWKRYLPKSYGYFINDLGGVVFDKYNVLGDGTTHNLLPLLTGSREKQLYESRRGFNNSKPVDGYPWIWKALRDMNYVTQFGEDGAKYGTFQYRLLGFKKQPTDHYMRTFSLKLDELYPNRKFGCLGSKPLHQVKIDWQKDFLDVYKHRKKFSFVFHSELSHEDNYYLSPLDKDLLEYLRYLKESGHLDNAALLLMSDHGHRYSKSRSTMQGKYEERLPFFGVALPSRVKEAYPIETKQLLKNQNKLVTPLDVHATMMHVVSLFQSPVGDYRRPAGADSGVSLFSPISDKRSCQQAGIEAHWCSCLSWKSMSVLGTEVKTIAYFVVSKLNSFTKKQRELCSELTFSKLLAADTYAPSDKLLSFKRSRDRHGREPDFSDSMRPSHRLYRLTLETQPGGARYEATVIEEIANGKLLLDSAAVSRVNAYGDQPRCLGNRLPHLRQFCHCALPGHTPSDGGK